MNIICIVFISTHFCRKELILEVTIVMDVTPFSLVDKFRQFTIFVLQRKWPAYVGYTCSFIE